MELLKDRRVVIGAGVALAIVAGVLIAYAFGAGDEDPDLPPPASKGGLVVEVEQPNLEIDLTRALPCYVAGELVGLATHADCAQKNGVSSGQLDVGIDLSGELAYGEPGASLAPLPPTDSSTDPIGGLILSPHQSGAGQARPGQSPTKPQAAASGPTAACWRYADHNWSRLADMPLSQCTQVLFDGRCEQTGGATYGRWGEQTLRLVPGRVEQSPDNRNFRTLVSQGANCSISAF